MKIVVLDGYTLNPGDLSWNDLAALGDCTVYDRTPPEQVTERAGGAEIVLTNKTVLTRDIILALPDLRYIGVLATGVNVVAGAAARERDIIVTNVPDYGTQAVAQMVFALLLELTQNVGHHAQTVRDGRWSRSPDFCYWDKQLVELAGLTMGIIGCGRIGQAVARIAQAFGMTIVATDAMPPDPVPAGIEMVDLDRLFRESDVITLHCPLTQATEGLVNTKRLAQMKSTAFLINTSRGPVVVEDDLADALADGGIAGAALDVLNVEPVPAGSRILCAPNCFITPHIAWATRSARQRLMGTAVDNVRAFLRGSAQNVVNA